MVTEHARKDNWILAFPYDKMLKKRRILFFFIYTVQLMSKTCILYSDNVQAANLKTDSVKIERKILCHI